MQSWHTRADTSLCQCAIYLNSTLPQVKAGEPHIQAKSTTKAPHNLSTFYPRQIRYGYIKCRYYLRWQKVAPLVP